MTNDTEKITRRDLIDPALQKAGWDIHNPNQVQFEIPVDGFDPAAWQVLQQQIKELGVPYQADLPSGICDYALYRPNGEIIAVVEAKRTSIDPRLALAQTEFYVTEIAKGQSFVPWAFMTNGRRIEFWDVGHANPREVAGFFSPADLENKLFIRREQVPLTTVSIDQAITDRPYQMEAIRRVCQTFEIDKKRKALLVMATGTGKTRTAMSLVDIFMQANQARRILFVADRDALVRQGLNEGFEEFIPHEPCARISRSNISTVKTNRLYAVTLQTLSNYYQEFTPSFFDLIIFDEVHRSIFNKWNEVLKYFDGRMIGLTATPAHFIRRNTFIEFECTDEQPTFFYSRREAVDEEYLVDYELYAARTKFQRLGIKGVDLNEEEQEELREQGIEPDSVDFSGTDLERTVTNKDTLRKQWAEIWDVCLKDRAGLLPGKTIVFAMTQAHALRLWEVFDEMYPQHPGLARVITYKSEHKGTAIKTFKKESLPRVAISVDMLETGVNVPEAVNLVFMRPIRSAIKLEQMIGRGTRSQESCTHLEWLPNGEKTRFLVIDMWDNNFDKSVQRKEPQNMPVLISLFNTRLDLAACYLDDQQGDEAQDVFATLRRHIESIPLDTYSVKKAYPDVERAWKDSYWLHLTPDKIDFLRQQVGPLLRFAPQGDVYATTFAGKVERLKLGIRRGEDTTAAVRSIVEDVSRLPDYVYEVAAQKQAAELCQSPDKLQEAGVEQLNEIIRQLGRHMKNRRKETVLTTLDIKDTIEWRSYIILDEQGEPVYAQGYRERVQRRVMELVQQNQTLDALARGEAVSDLHLLDLERALQHELGGDDLQLAPGTIHRAYAMRVGSLIEFLRQLLELDQIPDYQDIVRRRFAEFIGAHTEFNANQILFLRTMQSVIARKRSIAWRDLYERPFATMGANVVDRWFTDAQTDEIMDFAQTLFIGD